MKNDRLLGKQNLEHRAVGSLVSVVVLDGRDETDFLGLAASLARAARHPLSAAILGSGDYEHKLRPVERLHRVCRTGVTGLVDGHDVLIGNAAFVAAQGLSHQYLGDWADRLTGQGQEVVFVAVDSAIAGLIGVTTGPTEFSPSSSALERGDR